MIKLKLKPSHELGQTEIQFYDLFVSQDLSFISGRTSLQNSIADGETIKIVNNSNHFISTIKSEIENVTVKGKVLYKKELPVKRVKKIFNRPVDYYYEIVELENSYVEHNGDICFYCSKLGGYLVDHTFYSAGKYDESITIETHAYIEGDYAVVDGKKYYVDFSDNVTPIKDFPYTILRVDLFERKKWKKETKFIFRKTIKTPFEIDDVLYGGFENYVTYKQEDHYLSFLKKENDNGEIEIIGYGVELDGEPFTEINLNFVDKDIFDAHKDIDISDSNIQISDDEYLMIKSNRCSYVDGGNYIFLITKSEKLDIFEGNCIEAVSTSPIEMKYYVSSDEDGNEYVIYGNNRYDVEHRLYDHVIISEITYRLFYDNDEKTEAHSIVNGGTINFNISNGVAIPTNKIYYIEDGIENVKYGIYENGYEIHQCDGVKIGDNYYRVYEDLNDDDEVIDRYITINDFLKYELIVDGKSGSSTYFCVPNIRFNELSDDFENDLEKRNICNIIITNLQDFSFAVRNDVFGELYGVPENFLYDSIYSDKPVNFMGYLNLSMFKINSYVNVRIPFINGAENNLMKEDLVDNILNEAFKKDSANSIVDMEKDIYYPVYILENDEDKYRPISEIRFNMHFRTRQLDNWKVIEDYVETAAESQVNYSNWFVTDYDYYSNATDYGVKLQNVSDLVGYMNFTDSEVKNMAQKISKSFLRLSFYNTNNPNNQVLLSTSTIFLDEALLARKFFTYSNNNDKKFIKTQSYQIYGSTEDWENSCISTRCYVDTEVYNGLNNCTFDERYRLSSRITVTDKHNSDTSSEGFYFYMFREFSNSLRPKRVYLRIDFNHAGIGKTIPMIIPRKNITYDNPDGEPLYIHNGEDLSILEDGFKFKDIYNQLFIPIDVIYDEYNNRYVYYLPESLRENNELGVDDDIMEFNLFELKFKDESMIDNCGKLHLFK